MNLFGYLMDNIYNHIAVIKWWPAGRIRSTEVSNLARDWIPK